eukprot:888257-Pelagomonas_calceolata.AAC.1
MDSLLRLSGHKLPSPKRPACHAPPSMVCASWSTCSQAASRLASWVLQPRCRWMRRSSARSSLSSSRGISATYSCSHMSCGGGAEN